MSTLNIAGLRAGIDGNEILKGIDLSISSGEVHAVMGPNGSGKSTLAHVLMGRTEYEVLDGSVTLDGIDLLALPTWKRARAGLFLALQYPIEVPGVTIQDTISEAKGLASADRVSLIEQLETEADRIGLDRAALSRPLNVDFSGGEKKRNETLQLAVLKPLFAVLDEIDSGLDIDALRSVSRRIEAETAPAPAMPGAEERPGLGVLAITHYNRLLNELKPDVIHVMAKGRIVATGGAEMATELEKTGYAAYSEPDPVGADSLKAPSSDPFGDPFA